MKIIGIILIMFFTVSLGFKASKSQTIIANNSQLAYGMLCRIKMLLKYSQLEKKVLLNTLSNEGYKGLFSDNVKVDKRIECTYKDYIEELGTRDLTSELDALELALSTVQIYLDDVKASTSQKGKLYLSLGVIAGAFLTTLLI